MANGQAGWFGRNVLERVLPGTQINPSTGGYQNVGRGMLGALGRVAGGLVAGPAGSVAAGRLAGNWIDRGNPLQFRDPNAGFTSDTTPAIGYQGYGDNSGYDSPVSVGTQSGQGAVNPEPINTPGLQVQPNLGLGGNPSFGNIGGNYGGFNLPGLPTGQPAYTGQSAFDSNGSTINDRMNGWGNSKPSTPGRRGSSILAEGQAAQDYVGGMQLSNWLGMKAPTGPGPITNRRA